jgi:hypothetical protein
MAEILTFIIGVKVYINNNTQEKEERRFKEVFKQTDKIMEPYFRELNKKNYINSFIDEIPELSYYEAAQLKKKLANIYIEWNDT